MVESIQVGEKASQNYVLETMNPGGHSSRPVPENAIYQLVRAVDRVSHFEFPVELDDANRAYFSGMSKIVGGAAGAAMAAVVKDPRDAAAVSILDQDQNWHAMLRTTCVATMLAAGHATNALPNGPPPISIAASFRGYSRCGPGAAGRDCR